MSFFINFKIFQRNFVQYECFLRVKIRIYFMLFYHQKNISLDCFYTLNVGSDLGAKHINTIVTWTFIN